MNKYSFFLGVVMLAAAVVFIYIDEPLTTRIICAAIFLIGAVLLYFTISNAPGTEKKNKYVDDKDRTDSKRQPEKIDTLALDFREPEQRTRKSIPEAGVTEENQVQQEISPLPPYQRKEVTIPESYYRAGETKVPTDDPRAEFDFLVRKLLIVLKDLLIAHSVGLFWINRDRLQIVIGEYITDSKNFTTMRRVPLANDLISRVGQTGKPEIVTDIPHTSASDLLIYYDAKEGVRSFVGVPVYFLDEPIAVVTADSRAEDAFGVETVATIGHFTALVAILLRSYNQKYDLDADSKLLGTINRMRKSIQLHNDVYGIATAVANAASESVDWDYIAIVLNDEKKQAWCVGKSMTKSGNDPYIGEGTIVDLEKSLVGRAMQQMKSSIVHAPQTPEYRFTSAEKIQSSGQLCLVPLLTANRCFGIIVVEYKEKHQYGERDLEILGRVAEIDALAFETLSLNELTRNYLLIDEVTRVSSRALLLRRLHEERARLIAHGGDVTFFLVAVDNPEDIIERHSRHGMDALLTNIGKTLQSMVKPFDVVGKFDQNKFGVIMLYTGSEDAFLQGEKIRKAVASSVISFDGSSFSATVSVGGCVLTPTLETTQVLKTVLQAIERAVSEGGNNVKIV